MTPRQIDRLIAEHVFGEKPPAGWDKHADGYWFTFKPIEYDDGEFSREWVEHTWPPEYSSNIAAAWSVVTAMSKRRFAFSIYERTQWKAAFTKRSSTRPMPAVAEAPWPALAICKAALVALKVEIAQ